ncbi:MAG: hypothetical protein O2975_06480 [Proteobacteria bacterium]|nr:hypothetical protein [Pseudomonadota bacterium]
MLLYRGLAALGLACAALAANAGVEFDAAERAAILRHGPWPMAVPRDPSNRVSGNAAAIEFGEVLFRSKKLAQSGATACGRCHDPDKAWTDTPRRSWLGDRGRAPPPGDLQRNTTSLWNAGLARWYGWGGGSDSLWAFIIRPLEHPVEMGGGAAHVARLMRGDADFNCRYTRVFGPPVGDDHAVMVNVAKAIAAFLETLVSPRTPFDEFRDALERGDAAAMARYPAAAQRVQAKIDASGFVSVCHFGPAFTTGEFADIGVPFFIPGGGVDAGRHAGLARLRTDRHNLLGAWNDDPARSTASKTKFVEAQPRNFGEFKVPGLREAALTPPYMHAGSHATLAEVVRHYSELNEERLHADGERILRPLKLNAVESADLVAFLESLSVGPKYLSAPPSRCDAPRRP